MMTASETLRLLIVDDHAMFRQMLVRVLRFDERLDVVGEACDGVEALEQARQLKPDVVLMDITMPRLTGIDATRALRAEMPEVRIVGLSMHNDESVRDEMLRAGADDYIAKDAPLEHLIRALVPKPQSN